MKRLLVLTLLMAALVLAAPVLAEGDVLPHTVEISVIDSLGNPYNATELGCWWQEGPTVWDGKTLCQNCAGVTCVFNFQAMMEDEGVYIIIDETNLSAVDFTIVPDDTRMWFDQSGDVGELPNQVPGYAITWLTNEAYGGDPGEYDWLGTHYVTVTVTMAESTPTPTPTPEPTPTPTPTAVWDTAADYEAFVWVYDRHGVMSMPVDEIVCVSDSITYTACTDCSSATCQFYDDDNPESIGAYVTILGGIEKVYQLRYIPIIGEAIANGDQVGHTWTPGDLTEIGHAHLTIYLNALGGRYDEELPSLPLPGLPATDTDTIGGISEAVGVAFGAGASTSFDETYGSLAAGGAVLDWGLNHTQWLTMARSVVNLINKNNLLWITSAIGLAGWAIGWAIRYVKSPPL